MGKKKRKTKSEEEGSDVDDANADHSSKKVDDGKSGEATQQDGSDDGTTSKEEDKEMKLFGRWSLNVDIRDKGLARYMNLNEVYVPHFNGANTKKRFWKSKYSIVERLVNRLMTPGSIKGRIKGRRSSYHSGKKQKVLNIIRRALELVYLKTGKNPVQLLVRAIEHAAPREDTTRISMGGISYQSAVDVAPQRRLDMALHYLALGATRRSYNSPYTIEECLASEILAAASNEQSSFAVSKKEEKERIAFSAR
ncbi:MAG: 30S ribosomal protein S7 [Promethearchaeota archaeon]